MKAKQMLRLKKKKKKECKKMTDNDNNSNSNNKTIQMHILSPPSYLRPPCPF